MGLETSNPTAQIAVTFDKLHLARMEIDQAVFDDDAQTPVYKVRLVFRHYGVVNGIRHYKEGETVIGLSDFISAATAKAATGDMAMLGALQSIEQACAIIYTDGTGNSATVV